MSDSLEKVIRFNHAQVGGLKLHYAIAGNGPELVIMLHGFPEFWYSWRHQILSLSSKYTVVAPDLRGYNLSDKPKSVSDYEMEKLKDDVVGLIGHFGREQAALVGHDWGAAICWAVAASYPQYVSKLACLQVPPASVWKKNQTVRQFLASWYMFFFQIPVIPEWFLSRNDFYKLRNALKTTTASEEVFLDSDIEKYRETWKQPGSLTSALNYYRANILKRMFAKRDSSSEARISVPTLFIYGEQDTAVLPQTVRGISEVVDGDYTEVRISDSAHWVQVEAKEQVTEALENFLKKS